MRDSRARTLTAPGARLDRRLAVIQRHAWLAGQYAEGALHVLASRTVVRSRGPLDRTARERAPALPWRRCDGKIDRQALPSTATASCGGPVPGEALADPRQNGPVAIGRELIGIGHVRAQDSFFDLGGHSSPAVESAARLPREAGVWLRLPDVASAMFAGGPPGHVRPARPDSLLGRLRRRLGWSPTPRGTRA